METTARVDMWIGTQMAGEMLGWTPEYVRQAARKGRLRWRMMVLGTRFAVRLGDVEAIRAAQRMRARTRPRRMTSPAEERAGEWMTCREVGRALGVSAWSVADLVRYGRLAAWQAKPGQHGSALRIARESVERLQADAGYRERRRRCRQGQVEPLGTRGGWAAQGILPSVRGAQSAAGRRDHGAFYTARQAAAALGVSVSAVHRMRQRGRLAGLRQGGARSWWFFSKAVVEALRREREKERAAR